ncbi:MAG: hypothetical protein KF813_07835 [Trueperaceae bacterium]|nr:hypothetical protein [Trueperaceae bacterium]
MSRFTLRILTLALVLTLLAACSQEPSGPRQHEEPGTVFGHAGAPTPPLAMALLLVDPEDAFISLSPESLIEVVEGVYVGEVSAIGTDGEVTLRFPDAADIPSTLLRPAESLAYTASSFGFTCNLEASDPTARVTAIGVESLIFYAGVVFFTVEGAAPGIVLADDSPFPPPSPSAAASMRFQTWTYANKPVSIVSDPEFCGDPTDPPTLKVDVDLTEGWNRLEWAYIFDGDDLAAMEIRNSTATELFFHFGTP